MLRPLLLFALIIIVAEPSMAQIRATTEGGNNVLLFDNGTWKYDEKSGNTAENSAKPVEVVAVATIVVDSTKIYK